MTDLELAFIKVDEIQDLPEKPRFELERRTSLIASGDNNPAWYAVFKWDEDFVISRSEDLVFCINKACEYALRKLKND